MAETVQAEIDGHAETGTAPQNVPLSEDICRRILDLGSLIPWIADAQGDVVACGDRWVQWTGTDASAPLGDGWIAFIHPADRERAVANWRSAIRDSDRFDEEWRIRVADGSYRWCHGRGAKGSAGESSSFVWYGMLEDVHDRHVAADEFQRSQTELANVSRLSAMGAMATAIAHDLNQPLTAVVHYLRGARKLLASEGDEARDELAGALEDADKSAVRASDIVRRAREFVRRGTVETRREDLGAMIEEASHFATMDAEARGVTWRIVHGAHCHVAVDRVQIQQVLVNLIRNAIEAVEGRPRREVTIRSGAGRPGYCEVSVSDTGPGFSADAAVRMFDPFFTTRREGMGVGLPISRMIVEAHDGIMWLEQEPGEGANIKFSLPRAPAEEVSA